MKILNITNLFPKRRYKFDELKAIAKKYNLILMDFEEGDYPHVKLSQSLDEGPIWQFNYVTEDELTMTWAVWDD